MEHHELMALIPEGWSARPARPGYQDVWYVVRPDDAAVTIDFIRRDYDLGRVEVCSVSRARRGKNWRKKLVADAVLTRQIGDI